MTSCLLALIPENKNSHISQEKQSMAVLYPLSPVGYASLKEVLGALLPDTSASQAGCLVLCGSCSSLLLHLPCLLPQMGQCTHADTALNQACALSSSAVLQRHLWTPQDPEEQAASSTWKVVQVHLLQSNFSLGDEDLSAALIIP